MSDAISMSDAPKPIIMPNDHHEAADNVRSFGDELALATVELEGLQSGELAQLITKANDPKMLKSLVLARERRAKGAVNKASAPKYSEHAPTSELTTRLSELVEQRDEQRVGNLRHSQEAVMANKRYQEALLGALAMVQAGMAAGQEHAAAANSTCMWDVAEAVGFHSAVHSLRGVLSLRGEQTQLTQQMLEQDAAHAADTQMYQAQLDDKKAQLERYDLMVKEQAREMEKERAKTEEERAQKERSQQQAARATASQLVAEQSAAEAKDEAAKSAQDLKEYEEAAAAAAAAKTKNAMPDWNQIVKDIDMRCKTMLKDFPGFKPPALK